MHLPVQLLGQWDQSADTAETLARDLAYGYKVKDCEPEQEAAFKAWLAGETDKMPEKMPISQYVAYSFVVETNRRLCYLSQFSSFPERLCAYAFKIGQITTIQWMMRQMLLCLGTDYTHTFLNNTATRYQVSNKQVMRICSGIYAGQKTKLEKEFYLGYIRTWLENDREEYLASIGGLGSEWRRKILKALQKAELIQ